MVDYVEKIVTVPANANSVTIYADPGEVWKITGVPYCWNLPQGDPIWANIEQSGGNIANIGQWKPNTEVYISDTIGLRLTFAPYGSDNYIDTIICTYSDNFTQISASIDVLFNGKRTIKKIFFEYLSF